jgi:hypothetical protein
LGRFSSAAFPSRPVRKAPGRDAAGLTHLNCFLRLSETERKSARCLMRVSPPLGRTLIGGGPGPTHPSGAFIFSCSQKSASGSPSRKSVRRRSLICARVCEARKESSRNWVVYRAAIAPANTDTQHRQRVPPVGEPAGRDKHLSFPRGSNLQALPFHPLLPATGGVLLRNAPNLVRC